MEIGHEDMSNTTMLWLWDPQERYVYQPDYSSFHVPGVAGPEEPIAPYVGLWEYQGENLWLRIREDATWEFVNDQDDVIEYGTLWVDENGVTLHFDGSGDTLQLDRTVSGDLIDSVNNGTLLPVEGIQSQEPYFARNGLEINAAVEMGTFLLEDGVCSYSGLGDGYNTDDCYWEIVKNGDYTHDGIRELLCDLHEAGRRLAITSSKNERLVRKTLAETGIDALFDAVVAAHDPKHVGKEHLVSSSLEALGCQAADAVMVGDRFYDIEGARANGVASLGVYLGNTAKPGELEHAGATACVSSVADMRRALLG